MILIVHFKIIEVNKKFHISNNYYSFKLHDIIYINLSF